LLTNLQQPLYTRAVFDCKNKINNAFTPTPNNHVDKNSTTDWLGFLVGIRYNKSMRKNISGFTIVELLIVIVVIGILAAITIVAYNGVQNRAYDTSVQSDLRNIAKQLEVGRVDSPTNSYPVTNATIAAVVNINVNKNSYVAGSTAGYNLLMCFPTTLNPTDYALLAQSKSGKKYYIRAGGVISEYTGAVSWNGGVAGTLCDSVVTGWTASGAGYAASDSTTGPWRSWAGGN
jgi:prepilin-type N-terminal cleavage/methylation domain-containing protein